MAAGRVAAASVRPMIDDVRDRLVRLVRRSDADLAEVALLCATGCAPELEIDRELLRVDALADGVRTQAPELDAAAGAAGTLREHLGVRLGFAGDPARYHDPDSSLLHRVLETRRGLPITLSIVYVAIGRRLRLPAYAIGLPGHVVVGVADDGHPAVLDPYHGGIELDEPALVARVAAATDGRVVFRRSMLRPTPAVSIARRLLNNLTRDLTAAGRLAEARWTVETKLALPNRHPQDHRDLGALSTRTGRFDVAAQAYERYLELTQGATADREATRRAAIEARARLN
jgi:regulator of sirC expression with transglutaminase-like and TPR domain